MKKVYKDMLKELKKGNALLVEVWYGKGLPPQYRLVTPKSCEYSVSCDVFRRQNFINGTYKLTPNGIIEKMAEYDGEWNLDTKVRFVVL